MCESGLRTKRCKSKSLKGGFFLCLKSGSRKAVLAFPLNLIQSIQTY